MPSSTSHGYRYPEDADPVADAALAVRQLAQDVDNKVGAFASGQTVVPVTAAASGTVTITFPVGRFVGVPHVVTQARGGLYSSRPLATTADDFNLRVDRIDGSSATVDVVVDWIAHND